MPTGKQVGVLQYAAQERTNWSAVAGDTIIINDDLYTGATDHLMIGYYGSGSNLTTPNGISTSTQEVTLYDAAGTTPTGTYDIKVVDKFTTIMAATPLAARQIVPQFRFFRVEGIPVYTTSHAYAGTDNPQANSDMNGVEFTDMPWILLPDEQKSPLQTMVDEDLGAGSSAYRRLYAFGVDAFNVIPHLKQLSLQRSSSYPGVSGELYMHDRKLIQRKLLWARMVDGKPKLVNFISTY